MAKPSVNIEIRGEYDAELAAVIQQQADLGVRSLQHSQPDMAITFFNSALAKCTPDFPFYDHLVHNQLLAHKQRVEQLFVQERTDEALELLESSFRLELSGQMAGDPAFLRAFADAYHNMGLVFFENLQFTASIRCSRKALELFSSQTYYVNLTNALAVLQKPLDLSDLTTRIGTADIANHIFIACVPKSASTFLKNVLTRLTGYREMFAVFGAGQNEHDLYAPIFVELADIDTVTQMHCRASEANIQIMQAFGITPIVLVRNIFDAIVSQLDFYRNGAFFNSYFRADFMDLDEKTQLDLLIDNLAPWYLQFVASWQLAEKEKRIEMSWLTYEELTKNKEKSIEEVLAFYGLGSSPKDIRNAIASTEAQARKNRFNKGVAGRGKTVLSDEQRSRIASMTKYHPGTDFSIVGL